MQLTEKAWLQSLLLDASAAGAAGAACVWRRRRPARQYSNIDRSAGGEHGEVRKEAVETQRTLREGAWMFAKAVDDDIFGKSAKHRADLRRTVDRHGARCGGATGFFHHR